jgi:HEAT repeat protein
MIAAEAVASSYERRSGGRRDHVAASSSSVASSTSSLWGDVFGKDLAVGGEPLVLLGMGDEYPHNYEPEPSSANSSWHAEPPPAPIRTSPPARQAQPTPSRYAGALSGRALDRYASDTEVDDTIARILGRRGGDALGGGWMEPPEDEVPHRSPVRDLELERERRERERAEAQERLERQERQQREHALAVQRMMEEERDRLNESRIAALQQRSHDPQPTTSSSSSSSSSSSLSSSPAPSSLSFAPSSPASSLAAVRKTLAEARSQQQRPAAVPIRLPRSPTPPATPASAPMPSPPRPPASQGGSTAGQLEFYASLLSHEDAATRFGAAIKVHELVSVLPAAEAAPVVAQGLVDVLSDFRLNEDRLTLVVIETIACLGPVMENASSILVLVLRDRSMLHLFEACVACLVALGPVGLGFLLDIAGEGTTASDEAVLNLIIANPGVQAFAVVPILSGELTQPDHGRRSSAVHALARLHRGVPLRSLPRLLDTLIAGTADRLAVALLARSIGVRGEQALCHLAVHDPSPSVRSACFTAISSKSLGVEPGRRPLRVLVSRDAVANVNPGAVPVVLDRADGRPEEILWVDVREFVFQLRRAIDEEREEMRDAVYSINRALDDEEEGGGASEGGVERAAPQVEAAVQTLLLGLRDRDPTVREVVVDRLSFVYMEPAVASGRVVPALLRSLADPGNRVRASAARTLGNLGPGVCTPTVLAAVVELVKDSFYKARFEASAAIGKFGRAAANAVPVLVKALRAGSIKRMEVASDLCALGRPGVQALLDIIADAQCNIQVRIGAAQGLAQVPAGSPLIHEVADALYRACADRQPLLRRALLESLGTLAKSTGEGVPFLRARSFLPFVYTFLRDPDVAVREVAACVLGYSGSAGELMLIEGLLKDQNPVIRSTAAYGLMHVGPDAIRSLLLGMHDSDPAVRLVVAKAIETIGSPAILHCVQAKGDESQRALRVAIDEVFASPYPMLPSLESLLQDLQARLK